MLTLLGLVEGATGGFGLGLDFWRPAPILMENPFLQFVVYATPLLASAAVGIGLGIVFKRWGASGVYALTIVGLLLIGGAIALIGWLEAWGEVGRWFAGQTTLSMAIALPFVLTIVGALSFAGLRRVVP